MNKSFIQNRIAMLILHRNTSEKEVSRQLGRSPGYIQSITSGKSLPSLEMLLQICEYFGLTPAEFFVENGPTPGQLYRLWEYSRQLNEQQLNLLLQIMEILLAAIHQSK